MAEITVKEDWNTTVRTIQALMILVKVVNIILHKYLKVRKLCPKNNLTKMVAIFFGITGHA